jgi:hypothetical protein
MKKRKETKKHPNKNKTIENPKDLAPFGLTKNMPEGPLNFLS